MNVQHKTHSFWTLLLSTAESIETHAFTYSSFFSLPNFWVFSESNDKICPRILWQINAEDNNQPINYPNNKWQVSTSTKNENFSSELHDCAGVEANWKLCKLLARDDMIVWTLPCKHHSAIINNSNQSMITRNEWLTEQ